MIPRKPNAMAEREIAVSITLMADDTDGSITATERDTTFHDTLTFGENAVKFGENAVASTTVEPGGAA
jgi:hypothetical protein